MATEAEIAHAVLNKLVNNPKTRKQTLSLLKEMQPDLQIPEIDAVAPVNAEIDKLRETVTSLEKKLANAEEDGKIQKRLDSLRAKRGYTDEGVKQIVELMTSKNIADFEAAADHFDAETQRKAPPSAIEPGFPGYQPRVIDTKREGVSDWLKDPEGMMDSEISAILADARAGRSLN